MSARKPFIVAALLTAVTASAAGVTATASGGALLGTAAGRLGDGGALLGAAPGASGDGGVLRGAAEDNAGPRPEEPSEAGADTTLDRYLFGLSDSTDRYFGATAAPRDTTGLDSALAYGLTHPELAGPRARRALRFGPGFAFNRVDGPVWGGYLGFGNARAVEITMRHGWAAGPGRLLGEGALRKVWPARNGEWRVRLSGGRTTAVMDRTAADHGDEDAYLATLLALFGGGDRRHYLRHDGWAVRLSRENESWRAGAGYRDMLETPLATTTTWTLVGGRPKLRENLPAAFGRAHEAQLEVALRWPRLPIQSEIMHQTSGHAIGSDFEYRRTRAALAATVGLGTHATLVPQAAYGRLTGRSVPQAAFYLGGSSTLRSLESAVLGGTGLAVARIEVDGTDDLLALAHVPHPAWLPLQAGAFVATGAVWGADPYGGPGTPGGAWPRRERWLSEAGLSLIYQPGIPDPTGMLRFDWAVPLGPGARETRLSFAYTRAIDLLRPLR